MTIWINLVIFYIRYVFSLVLIVSKKNDTIRIRVQVLAVIMNQQTTL